jgi:hypothetical protein
MIVKGGMKISTMIDVLVQCRDAGAIRTAPAGDQDRQGIGDLIRSA